MESHDRIPVGNRRYATVRAIRSTVDHAEGAEFAGDCCNHDIVMFAAGGEASIAGGEPQLCFPGEVTDLWIDGLGTPLDDGTDFGAVAIGPGGLDEQGTRPAVAAAGDRSLTTGGAGAVLAGHQAEPGHEVTRLGEAAEIAGLGDDRIGDGLLDAAEGLLGRSRDVE